MDWAWIDCKDRLPVISMRVLGYDIYYNRVDIASRPDWNPKSLIFMDSDDCCITHWMPLPLPSVRAY